MRTVRSGCAAGLLLQLVLLAFLDVTVGLTAVGWIVGLACAGVINGLLALGLTRTGAPRLGPADRITQARSVLVGGVAALVASPAAGVVLALVVLSAVALVLDGVDGQVARRTGSASAVGARFDMEVDALLIAVLSVYLAPRIGGWVLAIGAARYAYLAAGRVWGWLREPSPPRYWGKVVAAVQGIVLTVAASGLLPVRVVTILLLISAALLAESFGREVWWLARHRPGAPSGRTVTTLTFLIAWLALVLPDRLDRLTPRALLQIPVEGLVLVAVVVLLPRRVRRVLTAFGGALLGAVVVLKVLDMGFYQQLNRPFNPAFDWSSFAPAVGVIRDSVGSAWARAAVVGAVLLGVVAVVVVALSMVRVGDVAARHRRNSARSLGLLAATWGVCAGLGVAALPGVPVASRGAVSLAADQVRAVRAAVHDRQQFRATLAAADGMARIPPANLLAGLRGKDVVIAFVESYGQVAVQDSSFSPGVDAVLKSGTQDLRAAGYSARSGFLSSPTFGGISWLAHSTLQSGLWINNQQRYDQLVASDRFTLSGAFKKAGWRTVGDVPSDGGDWPPGRSFYHYDQLYNRQNVGYAGPSFSYASMPDQYTLAAFQRRELAPGHAPVMAEIDLVTSHTPWTPLPSMVDWNQVGDGSVFDGMPAQGLSPDVVWQSAAHVQQLYGLSIQYSLTALISWVTSLHDDNLVLVLLGDHQPATVVSGTDANHDVPISIVAHDPAVLDSISSWGWQDGLLPDPQAPVWPMDAFRDRFLGAYSDGPLTPSAAGSH